MALTAEDEFAAALAALVRLAERVGLNRERDMLKMVQLCRSEGCRSNEYLAAMHGRCSDVLWPEDRNKLVPDPDFPPPEWTGLKPRIMYQSEGKY